MTDTTSPTSGTRRKLLMFGGPVLLLVLFGGLYLLLNSGGATDDLADRNERAQAAVDEFAATQDEPGEPDEPEELVTTVPEIEPGIAPAPGEVLVINRTLGDDYGRLAIRHTDGTRTLLERRCVRVHLAADTGVCVSRDEGTAPLFTTTFFASINPNVEIKSYPSALPSRARISPEGTFSAVTAFVSGGSYEDIGSDTTTIVTIDEIDSTRLVRGGNQLEVNADEDKYQVLDAQYWGMSFADEDEFYITGFYGDEAEVMHGTLTDMTVEPTGWVGSCPSLSPDDATLVFKEMTPNGFQLVAVDVESQTTWKLGETRSVDDQVEWLDNDTILYALHPEGGDTPVDPQFDIWMLDIAEGSEPALFLANADSPAVAR